jgi:hypothetical protein
MSHPAHDFLLQLMRDFGQREVAERKWEFWADGRRRSRTICITLRASGAELTIVHRTVGTDGCMSALNAFSCDAEHLPKLIHALNHALAVATERGLIKPSRK